VRNGLFGGLGNDRALGFYLSAAKATGAVCLRGFTSAHIAGAYTMLALKREVVSERRKRGAIKTYRGGVLNLTLFLQAANTILVCYAGRRRLLGSLELSRVTKGLFYLLFFSLVTGRAGVRFLVAFSILASSRVLFRGVSGNKGGDVETGLAEGQVELLGRQPIQSHFTLIKQKPTCRYHSRIDKADVGCSQKNEH
jgi:hypothetical protein